MKRYVIPFLVTLPLAYLVLHVYVAVDHGGDWERSSAVVRIMLAALTGMAVSAVFSALRDHRAGIRR